MELGSLLDRIHELEDGKCIFARKPWSYSSEAEVDYLTADFSIPIEVSRKGLSYVLEVGVAQEVIGAFDRSSASCDEARDLLIFYAENDAYPEWAYARLTPNGTSPAERSEPSK
jgi:hypothetical protein